jgi:hypothetical protein
MLARVPVLRLGQRLLALVSVLCLLAGAAVQAPRGCSVCPIGCPMHSVRPTGPGCHMGAASAHHAPEPASGCAVRSTCGHAERSVVGMPAVLASPAPMVATRRVHAPQPSEPRRPDYPAPEPAGHPPKLLRV